MRPYLLAVLAIAAALPAAAQSLAEKVAAATDIPFAEWRDLALGRTLTYRIGGELWALERYEPASNRVALQFGDGRCITGTWSYSAPLYCFAWIEEGTACFRHVRYQDEILIIGTLDGQETGAVQSMTQVSDTPLACGPAPTS